MPYVGERANPHGFSNLLEDPWVQERLATFTALDDTVKGDFSELPLQEASKLPQSHPSLTRVLAIDGSVSSTESFTHGFQVGAIKVAVVEEALERLKALESRRFIDPKEVRDVFQAHALTGILPGRGIGHRGSQEERTWQDKFRLELFLTFKHFQVPGTSRTLLQVLRSVMAPKVLICSFCKLNSPGEPLALPLPAETDFISCPQCHRGVYSTDSLFLDSELTYLDNGKVFLSAMNLVERFLMAGLLETSSPQESKATAFITDGPLAFFSSDSDINNRLLYHIQRQKHFPLLFGLEKTGVANGFAQVPEVQERLLPGHFAMVTEGIADQLSGKASSRKSSYAYGKRFLYRTVRGDKTFVVMVPPRVGLPYQRFDARCEEWSNYPTLGSVAALLEEAKTERFGTSTAALAVVGQANFAASLPKVLSEHVLASLVSTARKS